MTLAALLILALPLQELLSALEFNMDLQQAAQAPRTAGSAGVGQRFTGSPPGIIAL